jgi:hypothetical protein
MQRGIHGLVVDPHICRQLGSPRHGSAQGSTGNLFPQVFCNLLGDGQEFYGGHAVGWADSLVTISLEANGRHLRVFIGEFSVRKNLSMVA